MPARPARAQTLAELLICLATLVPVLLVMVGVFPFACGLDRTAWARLKAQEEAQTQLEQLRAANFDSLTNSQTQDTQGGYAFTTDVAVDIYPTGQGATVRQKRATVTVRWTDRSGPQTLQVVSLIPRWASQ